MVRGSPKISRNRMTKIVRESVALENYFVTIIAVVIIAMWLHRLQEAKHDIPITLACV